MLVSCGILPVFSNNFLILNMTEMGVWVGIWVHISEKGSNIDSHTTDNTV